MTQTQISLRSAAAVFFDLDGTLLDTAPDLARALNTVRIADGLPAMPLARVRGFVSHGVPGLLRIGYDIGPDDARFASLRLRVLEAYEQGLCVDTQVFDGMEQVLDALDRHRIPWGIVTNKASRFTGPIVAALGLDRRASCVISGDSAARSKPFPDPLHMAADQTRVAAHQCVYVGDAERDIQAGRAAGMATVAALFGYLKPDDDPHAWQADVTIDRPQDLLTWLV
ncbi:MAG: HAD-IA family hydrolase [Gammaproteobacteria bacterium]|nr:HAD-IA family hydrolase [Gammaproteobacteria bacterium]